MNKLFKFLTTLFCVSLLASCTTQKVTDITYIEKSQALIESYPKLDVYQPHKFKNNPVVIFIHGGYWESGNKEIYKFLGRNFAKKGIVTVIPSYTLSPKGNYYTMAKEVAEAIKWTVDNIEKHKGNPKEIFLMGHSAGGHLIALTATNPKYLETNDVLKGVILNDAAGLDMYSYLKKYPPTESHNYNVTWTKKEENWKDASPIYFLSKNSPPFLIFMGTKTYPSIISGNNDFIKELNKFQPNVNISLQAKKHVPMMTQFFFPWNKNYKKITKFIKKNK